MDDMIPYDSLQIVLPFITTAILDNFSYRDSILVLTAMLTLAIPCAIAFKGAPGAHCRRVKTDSGRSTDGQVRLLVANHCFIPSVSFSHMGPSSK